MKNLVLIVMLFTSIQTAFSAGGICKIAFAKTLAFLTAKGSERIELGTEGDEYINNLDVDGYRSALWTTYKNKELGPQIDPETGELDIFRQNDLEGFSPKIATKQDLLNSYNGNINVASYFKVGEPNGKNTYKILDEIWSRPDEGGRSEDWLNAINTIKNEWAQTYKGQGHDLNQQITEAFEALDLYLTLKPIRKKIRPKDFIEGGLYHQQPLNIHINRYTYDNDAKKTNIEKTTQPFHKYAEITGTYLNAKTKFENFFGKPPGPISQLKNRLNDIKTAPGWHYATVFPLFVHVVRGGFKWTGDTWQWFMSKYFEKGSIIKLVNKQGYYHLRLVMIYDLLNRRVTSGKDTTPEKEEIELLVMLKEMLMDTSLLPRPDAVLKAQKVIYSVERQAHAKGLIKLRTPLFDNLDRYQKVGESNIVLEENEQATVLGKTISGVRAFYDKQRSLVISAIMVGGAFSATLNVVNGFFDKWLDDSSINHFYEYSVNGINNAILDYMHETNFTRTTGRSTARGWTLDNVVTKDVFKKHLSSFRNKFREDATYNFLQDPEYIEAVKNVYDAILPEMESYGYAQSFADQIEYINGTAKPKRVVKLIEQAYQLEYPDQKHNIEFIMNRFIENNFSLNQEFYTQLDFLRGDLYYDALYFIHVSFNDAKAHYNSYYNLFSRDGDAYSNFGKATSEFKTKAKAIDAIIDDLIAKYPEYESEIKATFMTYIRDGFSKKNIDFKGLSTHIRNDIYHSLNN